MGNQYKFKKPIRRLKTESQISELFDGSFELIGTRYHGQIGGYDIIIKFNMKGVSCLETKSEEALETCHNKILDYLINNSE